MNEGTKHSAGLRDILIAAGVPAAIVFLFNPLQIAWSNLQDMEESVGVLAGGLLVAALVAFLLGAALLWTFEKIGFRRAVPLAMAAGFMFWLHSAVLVWNYGVLDGTNIDWGEYRVAAVIELLLWIGIVIWAAMRPGVVRRVGMKILPALLLISSIGVGFTALNAPEAPSFHSWSLSTQNQHLFSKRRNVVLLVLDAFQADIFAELLEQYPELAAPFDGFTYYRNAVAGFAKTYPSLALMFTGRYYENREPLQEFLQRVYLQKSVPAALVTAGWDVGMYPYVSRTLHFDPAVASNIHRDTQEGAVLMEVAALLDLGLFRAVPHVLKRGVMNNHEWRFRKSAAEWIEDHAEAPAGDGLWRSHHRHADVRFVEELEHNGRAATEKPVFRYFHFLAPHAPFLLNEKLEMERLGNGRNAYVRQSKAALLLVERVLRKFRAMGIYDDATILIVSDHGGGEYGAGVAKQVAGRGMDMTASVAISKQEHASGLPLMLMKLPGEQDALRISDAPVSLADVAATLDALTIDVGGYPGQPIHEIAANAQRPRRYLYYEFDSWRAEYLPALKEFVVEGFSWNPAAWQATGTVLKGEQPPAEDVSSEPEFVSVNRTVSTADGAAGQQVFGSGWWPGEEQFTWSRGEKSVLHFRFEEKLADDVAVTLRLVPHLGRNALDSQRVIVRHDGKVLDELDVQNYGNYTVIVPLGPEGASEFDLVLEVPDAMSPASVLSSTDERVLGVGLYSFRIGASARVKDDDEFRFGTMDNGSALLRDGWSQPEPTLTWTNGSESRMYIPLDESLHGRDIVLRFSLWPFLSPPEVETQRVRLLANGEPVGEWSVTEGGNYDVVLPGRVTAAGIVDLVLQLPDATAPAAVSESDDVRKLGIALNELVIDME